MIGFQPKTFRYEARTARQITSELRKGIASAAISHGSDGKGTDGLKGFLRLLAHEHPKEFGKMLMKVVR